MRRVPDTQHTRGVPTSQPVDAHIQVLHIVERLDTGHPRRCLGKEVRGVGPEDIETAGAHGVVGALGPELRDLNVAVARNADGYPPAITARQQRLAHVSVGGQAVPPDVEVDGRIPRG